MTVLALWLQSSTIEEKTLVLHYIANQCVENKLVRTDWAIQ